MADTLVRRGDASRSIRDAVHDYIVLPAFASVFVDTRQFQRLRAIKQLGTCYSVWPGACHNRFEHCLGVYHLAYTMVQHLQKQQPELGVTEREVQCVALAGLLHDLGHGPWSHVWDGLFIPTAMPGKNWTHEQASEMMFDFLLEDNKTRICLSPADGMFIKALIAGEHHRVPREKQFLFDIVANKRNGIDVDKFDYILRDSHMIGEKGNLSLSRIINSARVIDDQICYDIKDANQINELCQTRFSLHKRIYNHKTTVAIEYMTIDALLLAEPYMHIACKIDIPEEYLHLTDSIMETIESTKSEELKPAQELFKRIRLRDLYKCVDFKIFPWEYKQYLEQYITAESIAEAAKDLGHDTIPRADDEDRHNSQTDDEDMIDVEDVVEDTDVEDDEDSHQVENVLSAKHVIVCLSPMHYGMKDKNPLDSIKFYNPKLDLNKCWKATPEDVTLVAPVKFGEILLRIYTRDARFYGRIQAAYRAVLNKMPDFEHHQSITPPPRFPSTQPAQATPPVSDSEELPSTPPPSRALARNASGGGASFSENVFTSVPIGYAPGSPSKPQRTKPVSGRSGKPTSKRGREKESGQIEADSESVKKRRRD